MRIASEPVCKGVLSFWQKVKTGSREEECDCVLPRHSLWATVVSGVAWVTELINDNKVLVLSRKPHRCHLNTRSVYRNRARFRLMSRLRSRLAFAVHTVALFILLATATRTWVIPTDFSRRFQHSVGNSTQPVTPVSVSTSAFGRLLLHCLAPGSSLVVNGAVGSIQVVRQCLCSPRIGTQYEVW